MILTRDGKEIVAIYKQNGDEVDEVKDANGRLVYTNTREITGTLPLSFTSRGKPLSDYRISGNTVQDGTPTPDAPVDVVGCGVRTGNLIDNANIVSGGWMAAMGTVPVQIPNPKRCRYNHFFAVVSKTIFYDFKDLSVNIVMMNSDGLSLGGSGFLSGAGSFTLLSNAEKISLIIAKSDATEDITEDYARSKNISLDYGYKLPLTVNGTESPIYLGEAQTTRKIKKLVLTGEEQWTLYNGNYYSNVTDRYSLQNMPCRCTHTAGGIFIDNGSVRLKVLSSWFTTVASNLEEWKTYLAQQYQNGTPVTVWYVLAEQETGIVNEPLMKIGNYADTITMAQAGVTIPTIRGTNVLDMASPVKPSEVYIKGKGIRAIT